MICSHGITGPRAGVAFPDLSTADWREVLRVNLDGVFFALRQAARLMIADGTPGSMVVVGSLASVFGQVRGQGYSASKGGGLRARPVHRAELARHGIRVNEILPGTIETPLAHDFLANESAATRTQRRIPMRRWGQPDEFAGVVVYLISEASRYHSGDSLVIDGGYAIY